jgi:hypothetical protein
MLRVFERSLFRCCMLFSTQSASSTVVHEVEAQIMSEGATRASPKFWRVDVQSDHSFDRSRHPPLVELVPAVRPFSCWRGPSAAEVRRAGWTVASGDGRIRIDRRGGGVGRRCEGQVNEGGVTERKSVVVVAGSKCCISLARSPGAEGWMGEDEAARSLG